MNEDRGMDEVLKCVKMKTAIRKTKHDLDCFLGLYYTQDYIMTILQINQCHEQLKTLDTKFQPILDEEENIMLALPCLSREMFDNTTGNKPPLGFWKELGKGRLSCSGAFPSPLLPRIHREHTWEGKGKVRRERFLQLFLLPLAKLQEE